MTDDGPLYCPKCRGTDCGEVRLREMWGEVWHQIICRTCGYSTAMHRSVKSALAEWDGE